MVEVETDGSGAPEQVRLAWATPSDRAATRAAAIEAARHARKAVVFAWSRNNPVFGLPGDQDDLIAATAAVNPNTVVVLNTSQPVAMPWLAKVKGVIQLWWTGDRGGEATADLLLGRVSPGGRLPFTWAKRLADYPATDPAHPERAAAGVNGVVTFSEGIDIGYRWFDRQRTAPLFPFGYGLSYARFDYRRLRVTPAADGGATVSYQVSNSGGMTADEVSQVYLAAPTRAVAGARFAVKALAGFARTPLTPGESRTVTVHLPARRFQYWSTPDRRWRRAPGARTLMVGSSSADIRLTGTLPAPARAPR